MALRCRLWCFPSMALRVRAFATENSSCWDEAVALYGLAAQAGVYKMMAAMGPYVAFSDSTLLA